MFKNSKEIIHCNTANKLPVQVIFTTVYHKDPMTIFPTKKKTKTKKK